MKGELIMTINNINNISSCSDEEFKVLAQQALRLNERGTTDEQPLRHLIDSDGTPIAVLSVTTKIFLKSLGISFNMLYNNKVRRRCLPIRKVRWIL